jgi:hypothetical protein
MRDQSASHRIFHFGQRNDSLVTGFGRYRGTAKNGRSMPSERYYRRQAMALLSWARATTDQAWADVLRGRAAKELEQAKDASGAITDLNPLLTDFNDRQMRDR